MFSRGKMGVAVALNPQAFNATRIDLARNHRGSAIGRRERHSVGDLRPQRNSLTKLDAFAITAWRNDDGIPGVSLIQRG